jgi:CDP-glycerol glycerophosphotransferase (TagB/SpsB family)
MVKHNGMSSERIVVTGLPRYDNLISKESSRSILVMPTWRDWNMGSREDFRRSDFLRNYRALLTNERLMASLRSEGRKIRFFPHFEIENKFRSELDFESDCVEICSYASSDIQEEIRTCDALVTDYSSVAWDVNYLRKPVYFFQFDKSEYELLRGSYVDLGSELPGKSVATSQEAVACLLDGIENGFFYDDASEKVSRRYYGFRDHENTERVYRAIRRLRNRDALR